MSVSTATCAILTANYVILIVKKKVMYDFYIGVILMKRLRLN